jgi:hypothetical protein
MAINQIIIPNLPKIPTQQQIRTDIGNATFDLPGLGRPSSPDPSKDTPKFKESRNLSHGNMQQRKLESRDDKPTPQKNTNGSILHNRGGPFSINQFTSRVSNDLLIPNKYTLKINLPPAATGSGLSGMARDISLRIDSLELPGKQLATEEVQYYGPPRKSAYGMVYEDLTFNVYLSKDLKERDFFSAWMDLVFNYNTSHVSYYNEIISKCTFESYDASLNEEKNVNTSSNVRNRLNATENDQLENYVKYSVDFEEAYPISIGTITYAYASDEIARLPVTMAYRKWRKTAPKSD